MITGLTLQVTLLVEVECMLGNFICLGIGALVGATMVIVVAVCSLSGELSRRAEEWSKEE